MVLKLYIGSIEAIVKLAFIDMLWKMPNKFDLSSVVAYAKHLLRAILFSLFLFYFKIVHTQNPKKAS